MKLRMKTLKMSTIRAAIKRGRKIADAWQKVLPLCHEWQAELCEIMLIDGLWSRMAKVQNDRSTLKCYWDRPVRLCDRKHKLVGFVMDRTCEGKVISRWNGEPRDGHEFSHSPGNCWNGVSRDCFGSLAEEIRMAFHLWENGKNNSYSLQKLERIYSIQIDWTK